MIRDDLIDLIFTPEMIEKERQRFRDRPKSLNGVPQCAMMGYYRERLALVASYAASRWAGGMVEIGCWLGKTTKELLKVAERHERRVTAVDPWLPHPQKDTEAEYQQFLKRTRPWADRLVVIRSRSQEPEAICVLRAHRLCFAFVDGQHTYNALLTDLHTVSHARIIAVDDIYYHPSEDTHTLACRQAFWDFARETGREMLWMPNMPEGYLIPREEMP